MKKAGNEESNPGLSDSRATGAFIMMLYADLGAQTLPKDYRKCKVLQ